MLLSWFEIYEANLRKIARHFIQLRNNHFGPPLFAFSVAADVMKGKKKKISMQCIVTIGSSFLIYYPFFSALLYSQNILFCCRNSKNQNKFLFCQQYVIDFLSSLWLIVFTCLRDVVSRFIFAVLKYTLQYSVKKVYFSAQVKPSWKFSCLSWTQAEIKEG